MEQAMSARKDQELISQALCGNLDDETDFSVGKCGFCVYACM